MTYLHLPANDPTVHVTFLGPLSTRQALPMWKELTVSPYISQEVQTAALLTFFPICSDNVIYFNIPSRFYIEMSQLTQNSPTF